MTELSHFLVVEFELMRTQFHDRAPKTTLLTDYVMQVSLLEAELAEQTPKAKAKPYQV